MSTEIKNTLFRFVTMRAPELIETEKVERLFVKHPDLGKSEYMIFFANNPGISRKINLKKASEHLKTLDTTFKKNEDLKSYVEAPYPNNNQPLLNGSLFEFAMWFTTNRAKFSLEQLNKKVTVKTGELKTFPLNLERKIILWDNLIYQILTSESNYIREAILSILSADLFLQQMPFVANNLEELRKLAQARVIMPKEIFTEDTQQSIFHLPKKRRKSFEKTTLDESEISKSMEITFIQQHLSELKSLTDGVSILEKRYAKENARALAAYQKAYDVLVKDAYANAEKIETVKIDPVTKEEIIVVEYTNLNLPEFEFLEKHNGKKDYSWIIRSCKEVLGYDTFAEIWGYAKEKEELLTQMLFERTAKSQKYRSSNGMLFPVIENVQERTTDGVILRSMFFGQKKKLLLEFNNLESGISIAQAEYVLKFENGSEHSGTSKTTSWVNGKLQVTIFNSEAIAEIGETFILKATFMTQDGREISVEVRGNSLLNSSGNLTVMNPITDLLYHDIGQGNNYGNSIITYMLSGIGKYDLYDKTVIDPENPDLGTNPGTNPSDPETNPEIPTEAYIPKGFGIRRLGIADYRKVEQEVCCYVPGEVSHIENVMASEYKERSTRRLRRSEDTITTSKEKESEKLTDTTSTDRFEMNSEVASVLAEDTHVGGMVNLNTKFGKNTTLNTGADFANNTTSEESNTQAIMHAKEVTERVLDRVVQKVKEERISKVIEEFEENNKHGFDNRKNTQHVSGVYRWVDKIYKNKIVNYGKRLMYEFMIPEPAAFHKMAVNENSVLEETIEKPIDPRMGLADQSFKMSDFLAVDENKAKFWAGALNAEIDPMPLQYLSVGKTIDFNTTSNNTIQSKSDSISIPDNYFTKTAKANFKGSTPGNDTGWGKHVLLAMGNYSIITTTNSQVSTDVDPFVKEFPISAGTTNYYLLNISFSVNCELTPEAKKQWQIETFNAIIKAYEAKLEEYNAKVSESKAMQTEKLRTNPLFYRQIENMVLRKNCIEYLVSHDKLGENSLISGNKLNNLQVNYEDVALDDYAAKVKFLEQAFEWELMSYNFYPFYWAYKQNWLQLYNVDESDDAIFKAFLQSGMARVILTIRPGFEEAVNWYMATGEVWNGGQVPTMDDKLFVSIIEELRNTEGEVEETWETRVPTSLTIIQAGSIGLEVPTALPCDEDCKDYKQFDSDGTPKLDEYGKPVSTNPFKIIEGLTLEGETQKN